MVLRAARGQRLGGVFRNQIKQVVAVDSVFTQRRRLADLSDNVFDSLAQRGRQPWLQMVDMPIIIANLKYKTAFHFIVLCPIAAAIPVQFHASLRWRTFRQANDYLFVNESLESS